jgi:S1-C subfamily serine protease
MSNHFEDSGVARDSEAAPGVDETPPNPPQAADSAASGPTAPEPARASSAAGAGWVVSPSGPPEAIAPPTTPTPPVTPPSAGAGTPTGFATPAGGPTVGWPPSSGGGVAGGPPRAQLGRSWIAVALVSALIGGAVGAIVTAIADNRGSPSTVTTIREGSATPGPALASGKVTIPDLVAKVLPAVVSIEVSTTGEEDEGSGMIISPDGLVITNNHVIELATEDGAPITVTESGSTKPEKATLVGTDPGDDVALLRIQGASGLKTITFGDSDKAIVGDSVVAIGNALGLSQGSPTVTQGIVSAIGRTVSAGDTESSTETLSDLIQTDAAINPGNSGGPLIDTAGQVIGMNTAVAGDTGDGTSAQNIGFAIPSAQIESLIPQLQKGGTQQQGSGYIGVEVATLTAQLRQEYGFTPQSGAVILEVTPSSPADNAGLEEGDVIVAIDSQPMSSAVDVQNAIQKDKAGQSVTVTYYRGALKKTASVTLGSQEEEQQQQEQLNGGFGFEGGGLGGGGFGANGGFGG